MTTVTVAVNQFPSGLDVDRFEEEIGASSIVYDYAGCRVHGMNASFEFSGWDAASQSTFDGLVSSHSGQPLAGLRIVDHMVEDRTDHRQVNYKTGLIDRLHKYIDFDDTDSWFRGEIRRVTYWESPTRNNKVLEVTIQYARQPNGLLTRVNDTAVWGDPDFYGRRTTRTWFRGDGTPHPVAKVTDKTYDSVAAVEEGRRRRSNVVNKLTLDVLEALVYTETAGDVEAAEAIGMPYVAKYESQLDNYRQTGDLSLKTPPSVPNITDDTELWLDNDLAALGSPGVTIRDMILDSLKEIMEP